MACAAGFTRGRGIAEVAFAMHATIALLGQRRTTSQRNSKEIFTTAINHHHPTHQNCITCKTKLPGGPTQTQKVIPTYPDAPVPQPRAKLTIQKDTTPTSKSSTTKVLRTSPGVAWWLHTRFIAWRMASLSQAQNTQAYQRITLDGEYKFFANASNSNRSAFNPYA